MGQHTNKKTREKADNSTVLQLFLNNMILQ